jgi:glycosyltransferase involved in cell wall biosynthesis
MTDQRLRVLLLEPGSQTPEKRQQRLEQEAAGIIPKWSIFEKSLQTKGTDLSCVHQAPLYRRMFYGLLPPYLAMACEAWWRRQDYDVVVSGSEQVSLFFAILQRFSFPNRRRPHVALLYWMSKPNILPFFRIAHPAITRIVTWSSVQRDFALEKVRVPADKIRFVRHPVDPEFWRPEREVPLQSTLAKEDRYICSAGSEMRDYETLLAALAPVEIPCRIASKEIRTTHGLTSDTKDPKDLMSKLPSNVDIRGYTPASLRLLYQKSTFVVVPLLPTDTDNGITVILEAMACGKAVICTKTRGQVDVIRDGETGIFVPQGSPEALRKAIVDLWQNPEKAKKIGEGARQYIEQSSHSLSDFAAAVARTAREAWHS